jgi:hypothetical protein
MTDDLETRLRRQILEGPDAASIDPDDCSERADTSRWLRLLLAASDDGALHVARARRCDFDDLDAAGRVGWVRAEISEVDDYVDGQLESGESGEALDALARAGVGWWHESLARALDDEATLGAGSVVAARGAPDALRSAIVSNEVVEEAIDLLRAAALEGADELWDQFLIWRSRLEPAEDEELDDLADPRREQLDRIDGIGAMLEPTLYARGVLVGDYETRWLDDSEAVADTLQTYGATDWLEVLGILEAVESPARELASTLAVCAAHGLGDEPPHEDEIERLLDLLAEEPRPNQKESPWEEMATRLGFGLQIAIGEDAFGLLLAQAAAHERLVTHGVHSPGVSGLPLSATAPDDVDHPTVERLAQEWANRLVSGDDEHRHETIVSAVRTLCDAQTWLHRFPEEFEPLARAVADSFEPVETPAVALARRQLVDVLDDRRDEAREAFDEAPTLSNAVRLVADAFAPAPPDAALDCLADAAASGEGTMAMDAGRRLAAVGSRESLERIGDLWVERAPVLRAPFFRLALTDGLVEMADE